MNTPTHFLMTAALRKALPRVPMSRSAVLWGSVAPDIPLYLMTFGALGYFHYWLGWTWRESGRHIFGTLYFQDPLWIGFHNILHSPTSLLLGLLISRLMARRKPELSNWLHWFLLACLLHSIVDIVTHHDDGPLLFWPLDWQYRYQSPISYWDHRHYGSEMSKLEFGLDLAFVAFLVTVWIREKWFSNRVKE